MKKSSIGVATAAFAFAAVAMAQAPNPAVEPGSTKAAPPTFSAIDTNRDGKISREEARAHGELNTSFGTLDGDRDDNLSQSEYDKWHSKPGTAPGANRAPGAGAPQSNQGGMQQGAPGQGGQAPSGTR